MLAKSNNAKKSASTIGKSLVLKGLKAIEQNNLIGYNQCWLWLRFSHFDLLRWFLRKKKKIFDCLSWNFPYQCLFRKIQLKKIAHCACLRKWRAKLTPLMPLLAIFHKPHSTVHFSVAGSKGFQSKTLHGSFIEKQNRVGGIIRLITRFLCAVLDAQCNTEESPLDW